MPKINTELVIFDLDGTLVDSLGDLADSMNAVLEGLGQPIHSRDSYRYFIGDGIEKLVRRALPLESVNESTVPEIVAAMRDEYSRRWLATTRPFPGIPKVLATLRFWGIKTAVLSNKPEFATREVVGALFEDDAFDIVRGALDGVPLKPDPTSCLHVLSNLGINAARGVFVGDTSIDINTGVNAGMRTIGVTWGFRGADELRDAGAGYIVAAPLELLSVLEPSARRTALKN